MLERVRFNRVDQMDSVGLTAGLPHRHFACVLADPPWYFKTYTDVVTSRDPRSHYAGGVMSLADIEKIPVGEATADDAHLFLWVTGPMLERAFGVMRAWGFKYSGVGFVWVKLKKSTDAKQRRFLGSVGDDFHVGLGYTTRKNAEFCLLGRRGNAKRLARDVRELIISPRREHSRKPDEVYERIQRYAAGPYLELFGRQQREGWTVRGDEADKFKGA